MTPTDDKEFAYCTNCIHNISWHTKNNDGCSSNKCECLQFTPTDDQELDEIVEGLYRWTVEAVSPAIIASGSMPVGTGNAPILKPSKAKQQLLAWRDAGILKELEKWDECHDGCVRDRIKELKGTSDVTQ